eukprot:scaffold7259_cov77-Skeletonema_dohrnii-CCMP3373.AAC.2
MEREEYEYYEANASDISLEDITSSEDNAMILRRLRDGDDTLRYLHLTLGSEGWSNNFDIGEGNDLGWLGYFIGKSECLHDLCIRNLPDREGGEQQIHAFMEGIARNQSIRALTGVHLGDNVSEAFVRALGSLTQLEELVYGCNNLGPNGFSSTLGTLLESGVWKLKKLSLFDNDIGDDGVASLANGLRSIGSSLKEICLSDNSIGNEGLLTLMTGLESCTSLERLDLSYNDFSLAAVGLGSLSDWLQRDQMDLTNLALERCDIIDEGLQGLAEGAAKHCKFVDLSDNHSITASGLKYLSTSLQSESCRLEYLYIGDVDGTNVGDNGAEVLARGLVGNKSLKLLHLYHPEVVRFTPAGWSAFSTALCDTSSVNNTYLSNHTFHKIDRGYDEEVDIVEEDDERVVLNLQLNMQHPQYAARCKILMNHAHLDMTPLFRWGLKFLPLAVSWFERAHPCTTLSIIVEAQTEVEVSSEEEFQSRILTSIFEFVRGMPKKVLERRDELALVATYDEKIAMAEEESERLHEDLEQRDRKITQLEEENKRLRGMVESAKNALNS